MNGMSDQGVISQPASIPRANAGFQRDIVELQIWDSPACMAEGFFDRDPCVPGIDAMWSGHTGQNGKTFEKRVCGQHQFTAVVLRKFLEGL